MGVMLLKHQLTPSSYHTIVQECEILPVLRSPILQGNFHVNEACPSRMEPRLGLVTVFFGAFGEIRTFTQRQDEPSMSPAPAFRT